MSAERGASAAGFLERQNLRRRALGASPARRDERLLAPLVSWTNREICTANLRDLLSLLSEKIEMLKAYDHNKLF